MRKVAPPLERVRALPWPRQTIRIEEVVMNPKEIELLTNRVVRLERENRFLKCIGLGIVMVFTSIALLGATKTPRVVEAEKFVLVDSQGKARLTIGTPSFAGDHVGTNAARLGCGWRGLNTCPVSVGNNVGANADDPAIWLSDNQGNDRAMLTMNGVYFLWPNGNKAIDLSVAPDRVWAALELFSPDGRLVGGETARK